MEIQGDQVKVAGPLGVLEWRIPPVIQARLEDGKIVFSRSNDERESRALHGLSRNLVRNMVQGVSAGFEKALSIEGTGYRAELQGEVLQMSLGYSHPVRFRIPPGLKLQVDKQTLIRIRGIDKQLVGDTAAQIRSKKPPEPYRGKGVRYLGEYIKRKVGKTGAK